MKRMVFICCLLAAVIQTKAQDFGEPSFMTSIYFGGGSFFVEWDQSEALKEFIEGVENVHNYVITVHSHTDNIGGEEYNKWLSEMRSDAVIEELLLFEEIKPTSIESKDFGIFNPIHDNTTWEGRRMNRRVDIILWLAI